MPLVFVLPRKYFKNVIGNNSFKLKDLIYLGLGGFTILMALHIFESQAVGRYSSGLERSIYLIGFSFGLVISFAFRTYFLTMILMKTGVEVKYPNIGMIVGIAMIADMIMLLIPIILQTSDYNRYIEIVTRIWNLILILIGIVSITDIRWIKGALMILIMFGY